ncbi:MAG: hypothetical protein JXX14_18750 [Deltaproteobacteria bacterium]|nr:hypothetical protein [Deltaproteobacteria bacterium]
MHRLHLTILIAGLFSGAAFPAGCSPKTPPAVELESDAPQPAAPLSADPKPSIDTDEPSSKPIADVPLLAHGTHMVFGIRLPSGMLPLSAGEKVKRFEGTHSIESVKKYLLTQLAGKIDIRPNRFGAGYFISQAIPASSQRDLSNVDVSARKYNIKIYEGSIGGAGVDIWEAIPGETQSQASNTAHGSTLRNLTGTDAGRAGQTSSAPKVKYTTKKQREKATFDVFEKMARGQRLTEADYQSPFFTEN